MKKLISLLAALLATAGLCHAQIGIIGGYTASSAGLASADLQALSSVSQWQAGVAYRIKLGPVFALQPALSYQTKGLDASESLVSLSSQADLASLQMASRTGFLELGLGMQLGVDLLVFRPFLLLEPFIGYAVNPGEETLSYASSYTSATAALDEVNAALSAAKNKFEVGFGAGGGIELMNHLQISVQWFMNFGSLYDAGKLDGSNVLSLYRNTYKNYKNYQGIKINLGIFF